MDFGSINKFLENKTIFVTGATGFIAKILVEKILRTQPNVKKLYLLVRARDATTANTRLREEVLGKELFKVLREKLGANFEGFMLEKLSAVAGDTSYDNLGLTHHQLNQMYEDIDIVINVAATTKFWERYDVALGVNTLGPKHVINFANKCSKIQLLIHVSTAYVCGEKKGLISEKPYEMGETLNGVSGLDIDFEKKLIDHTLKNLKAQQLQEKDIRQTMKDLGSQRAKYYGWPNTYVFTKAMGEMLIGKLRGNLPVVILRPTIVCSTFKEPFPGWVEGCRTIDSVTTTYGKGRLALFLADNTTVLDLIPADMFVNSIIVAMKAHVNNSDLTIYQIGSSYRNPITFKETHEFHYHYFAQNPWTNDEGKSLKLGKGVVLNNIITFQIILFLWQFLVQMSQHDKRSQIRIPTMEYLAPGMRLACAASTLPTQWNLMRRSMLEYITYLGTSTTSILIFITRMGCSNMQHRLYIFDKKLKIVTKLVDLYKPYLFFKGIFEDTNTEKLLINARENGLDEDIFNFDCEGINWEDYFINVHLPSVVKYLF